MTIDKAIEILDNHQVDMPRNEVPDLIDAIKLGIAALRYYRKIPFGPNHPRYILLPGETKD